MNQPATPPRIWSFTEKLLFRFFCCLFIIYIFPFPLDSVPFVNELTKLNEKLTAWYTAVFDAYTNLWHAFIPWIASHILHRKTPITIFTNGSGDTTYDYLLVLTQITLSIIATIVWTFTDRNRQSYNLVWYCLRVLVRYYLAGMLILYGLIKIFHLQMPSPYLSQLVQPFGDKSPMGVAWSFVGYSRAYSAYVGWGEVIGGTLLLFRRTITLGGVISAVVMLNVVLLNFCFDIPVKLFSCVLLLMSVFLIVPDVKRLYNVLILNKPTFAVHPIIPNFVRWMRVTAPLLKWIFILYFFYSQISGDTAAQKEYGDNRKLPPLYGIYNTELVIRNKDTIAPLITDTSRWKQLIVQFEKNAQVKMMNDSIRYYNFLVDTTASVITLYANADTLGKAKLSFHISDLYLTVQGKIKNDSLFMRLKKYDINNFRLINRGFRLVNEYPYNR